MGTGSGTSPPTEEVHDFLAGGGELAELIRGKDWSATPLGAINGWPQSLRTAVSLCVASSFPINIIWGPENIQIYNDGYRILCSDAHPRALGEAYDVTWESAWPVLGEAFEQARFGKTGFLENRRMFLTRNGYLEETFFTFSLSPIRDESQSVGGLFHPVTETTSMMLSERRTRALRELTARLATASDLAQLTSFAVETLALHEFDLPFLLFYERDDQDGQYRLRGQYGVSAGGPLSPLVMDAAGQPPWPLRDTISKGHMIEVCGIRSLFQGTSCGPYDECPSQAFVVPLTIANVQEPPVIVVLGISPRLPLDGAYRGFHELIAAALSAALAAVRAREDDHRRALALADVDRAKTNFFANVSHEFRTPLTLVLGPLEQLMERAGEMPDDDRERVALAHRSGRRLLKLVNTLLAFSRIEAGRSDANYELIDIGVFTAELASNFRSVVEHAGLSLIVSTEPVPLVLLDRHMWETIVLNLLSNAFKFTLEGKIHVTVMASADGAAVKLIVSDTGIGIPGNELPLLFNRFHRVQDANGRSIEGSGIGLALARDLVKLHEGDITVISDPGQGSTFTVTIPFDRDDLLTTRISSSLPGTATTAGASAYIDEAQGWLSHDQNRELANPGRLSASPGPRLGGRVVLAEDNADMRGYIARLLEAEGLTVEQCGDGETALAAARRSSPDLILSDVMMPKLDGFELLAALRADATLKETPFVLLSARAGEEARAEGIEAGADDYVIKPFFARDLVARVAANLGLARNRREAILRASEARFRSALEMETVGTIYFDMSGTIFDANDAFLKMWNYDRADLESGRLCWQVLTPPEWMAASEHAFAELKATGRTTPYEKEYIRKDGTRRWALFGAKLLPDGSGFEFVLDINDRRNAELRLQQLNADLERRVTERSFARGRTWQLSPEIMGVLNAEGYFETSNPAWQAVLGWSEAEIANIFFLDFVHPDDLARTRTVWKDAKEHGLPALQFENRYRHKLAGWKWLSWVAVPDGDKVYCSARDVTSARKQQEALVLAEEALRQSHKLEAMGQLTGGVAHDFNNLLTPIIGSLDLLTRRELGNERERRLIDAALQSAERAKTLVQRLLAFARQQPLHSNAIHLPPLVGGMAELIRSTVGPAIAVLIDLADELPPVWADANQLEMAVLNLALNARDAMSGGGTLTIAGTLQRVVAHDTVSLEPGEFVRLSVSDTGVGMNEATRARAVEPFFSTKGIGKGTGLGLSMVHGLALQLGGGMTIESQPGLGSTVCLWLPVCHEHIETIEAPAGALQVRNVRSLLLLVDDDDFVRMITADMLIDMGYEVLEANSASNALLLISEGADPDILVTDHLMPGMSGVELAQKIRATRPDLPILIVSGYAGTDSLPLDLPRLTKPFKSADLARILAAM